MTRNYLTGRVNNASFGVPGLSTSGDLVVDVSGAIGVETSKPRAFIDTPDISIRGDILDADEFEGGLGYFLSKDDVGVKWVAASPIDLTFIRVFDDGVQIGPSSFSGLNFAAGVDETFVTIVPNATDPSIADIEFDVRWIKFGYGPNAGISTGFGPDGTYASLPGYGTSEASGITSVGVGTIQPQDDFQVGIGSTGVTINGKLGQVDAEIIKAKSISVEGNLEVESLVVRPGVATLTNLEVFETASIPTEYVGFSSIEEARVGSLYADQILAGVTTLGLNGNSVFILNDLFVQGGLGTFSGDVYVGGDLTVNGDTFFKQLNAENIVVTGIATIGQGEFTGIAVTDLQSSGFTTLTFYSFDTGFGTSLFLDGGVIGVATVGSAQITNLTATDAIIADATIGFASVGFVTATEAYISTATVGFLSTTGDLFVSGLSTFVGLGTFRDDLYVGQDLFVNGDVTFKTIKGEQLFISGIGTVVQLESDVGIITSLFNRYQQTTGVATIRRIESQFLQVLDIESRNIDNSGIITSNGFDLNVGTISTVTGNSATFGIGTITNLNTEVGRVGFLTGNNLIYYNQSVIDGTIFRSNDVQITRNLEVLGLTTFRGIGTFGDDLYVGNDLFVNGKIFFEQIEGENILITGIGTFNNLDFTAGIGASLSVRDLDVTGIATLQATDGIAATFTRLSVEQLIVEPLGRGAPFPGFAQIDQQQSRLVDITDTLFVNKTSGAAATFSTQLTSEQDTTLNRVNIQQSITGIATITDATIGFATVGFQTTNVSYTGLGTFKFLTVETTGTYEQDLIVEGTAFINDGIIIGVSTIQDLVFNSGVGTNLVLETATTGISTIGLASITRAEVTSLDVYETNVGLSTIGFATIGTGINDGALYVVGVNTFVGFTTFTGDVFVEGDFTVTGVTSFRQLDSAQSQIGILTVFERLDSRGFTTARDLTATEGFRSLGVSTIGLSTFKNGDLNINRNLTVGGITTFQGTVVIEETSFVNTEVTGVASIGTLFVNTGVATNFAVDNFDANIGIVTDLTVTGASTFIGLSTFIDNVGFGSDVFINRNVVVGTSVTVGNRVNTRDLNVSGIATIANENVGFSTIRFANITDSNTGVATVGVLSVTDVTVTGITTFEGDIDINSDVTIEGKLVVGEFGSIGLATFTDIIVGTATIGYSDTTDALIGVSTIGFSSITELFAEDLQVVGTSTFVGFTTFTGDVVVDGDLSVTGVVSFIQLDAEQSRIGILTVSKFINFNDAIQEPTGFTTLNRFSAQAGVITSVTAEEVNAGVLTVTGIASVGGSFLVAGITTLGNQDPVSGFVTTLGDLYVGGDLFVQDDIIYDEITGRNLSISGIATIQNLEVPNQGSINIFSFGEARGNLGVITTLRVDSTEFNRSIGTSIVTEFITATGPSTYNDSLLVVGEVEFQSDLTSSESVSIAKSVTATDFYSSGEFIGNEAEFTDGIITNLVTTDSETTNLRVTGIATVGYASITDANVTGVATVGYASITDAYIGILSAIDANVSGVTSTFDLFVSNDATFIGTVIFDGNVTVKEDLVVEGDTEIVDFIARNGNLGILTANSLETRNFIINEGVNGSFFVGGASTFTNNLDVQSFLYVNGPSGQRGEGFINAGTGIITSVFGVTAGFGTGVFESLVQTKNLEVNNIPALGGVPVNIADDLQIGGDFTANSGSISALSAEFVGSVKANTGIFTSVNATVSATIESLVFNKANGNDANIGVATITYANIPYQTSGIATIGIATIAQAYAGIITAFQQYDLTDTTTITSFKGETNTTFPVPLYSIDPSLYGSFEMSIDAREAGNVHSTKIHGVFDNLAVPNTFANEYSTVFNAIEVAEYSFLPVSGTETELIVTPANANTTEYIINIQLTRRF